MESSGFKQLGRELREALDAEDNSPARSERHREQRAALIDASQSTYTNRWFTHTPLRVGFAALALAVGLVGIWFTVIGFKPNFHCVDDQKNVIAKGTWLSAESNPQALHFSDGSRMILDPISRATLTDIHSDTVTLRLENGSVHASIVPGEDRSWNVECGPFSVRVLGTVFDVEWDPQNRRFSAYVERGHVAVFAPHRPSDTPFHLRNGERLEIIAPSSQAGENATAESVVHRSVTSGSPSRDPMPINAPSKDEPPQENPPPLHIIRMHTLNRGIAENTRDDPPQHVLDSLPLSANQPKNSKSSNLKPSAKTPAASASHASTKRQPTRRTPDRSSEDADLSTWKHFAQRGDYARAWNEAEQAGLQRIQHRASADDLLLLADVARYHRQIDASIALLNNLRTSARTQATHSEQATFRLGRIYFDQLRNYDEALTWFDTYLNDFPQGQWAKEVYGLRLETLSRNGSSDARKAAEHYLQNYPQGAYRALAQKILNN